MPIDTEIEGSPSSIRSAAAWLGDVLEPAVSKAGDSWVAARRSTGSEWRGETGEAFCQAMGRAITQTDNVEQGVSTVEAVFVAYAADLARCQSDMSKIRSDATSQGLTVSGFVIQSPGGGPNRPGNPPEDASQGKVNNYDAEVEAYNHHQRLIEAYNECVVRAQEVLDEIARAWERVAEKNRGLDGPTWTFNLSNVAGGLGGALIELHTSILSQNAKYFGELAADNLSRLTNTTRVPNAAQFYDDLDRFARMGSGAADDAARAGRLLTAGKAMPLIVGGVLTGASIWYDMEYNDESTAQAVTSNVGSFGASVAAGAIVGTMIGGPVGTVAGVIVGAGVGVFTSGMIDGLWDHNGNVGDALMAGVDTLVDTGEALVDVGGAIIDGIGGLFD